MELPRVSFIMPTRNRKEELRRAILSIRAQDWPQCEVVVADNASEDGTLAMLQEEFPEVILVRLEQNFGISTGRNRAIERSTGSILVCMDDDIELVGADAVRKLVGHFERFPQAGGIALQAVEPGTLKVVPHHIPRKDRDLEAKANECGVCIGGNCAFRREVFDKAGYYWEYIDPFGSQDLEFSYRVIDAGYSLIWARDILMVHHDSPLERFPWRRHYYIARNRPWIAWRNLPWYYALSTTFYWWSLTFLRLTRRGYIGHWCKAVFLSVCGMRGALQVRKPINQQALNYCKQHSGYLWH